MLEILFFWCLFKWKFVINHPVQNDPQWVYIAFAGVFFVEKNLWSHGYHRTHLLLKGFPLLLEYLPSKAKVSYFQYPVVNKYIWRLDVSMHEVVLVEFLESVENLWKVVTNVKLIFYLPFVFQFSKIEVEVLFVAKLKHDKNLICFTSYILDLDDVLVLSQFY